MCFGRRGGHHPSICLKLQESLSKSVFPDAILVTVVGPMIRTPPSNGCVSAHLCWQTEVVLYSYIAIFERSRHSK